MFPRLCAGLGWLTIALSLSVMRARCADLSAGRSAYDKACAHCHGNDGAGWPEKNGPTLHGTDWVTGDPDRLIRITLGGLYLRIPLKNGTHYGGMTGAKDQLNDREVAAVLTYIRQSWGNAASAIEPAQVAKLRPEVDARKLPYFAKDFGLKAEPKFGPNGEVLEPPDPFAAAGFKTYTLICQNCHQPDGRGMVTEDGHGYPPLAGSAYVTGSKRRLVRIVLGGMQGPVVVNGKSFSEVMPPWHAALDDTQIAQVLTFIRQSWMNLEPRISPALVKELRKESEQRAGVPWAAPELDQLDAREAAQARAVEIERG